MLGSKAVTGYPSAQNSPTKAKLAGYRFNGMTILDHGAGAPPHNVILYGHLSAGSDCTASSDVHNKGIARLEQNIGSILPHDLEETLLTVGCES